MRREKGLTSLSRSSVCVCRSTAVVAPLTHPKITASTRRRTPRSIMVSLVLTARRPCPLPDSHAHRLHRCRRLCLAATLCRLGAAVGGSEEWGMAVVRAMGLSQSAAARGAPGVATKHHKAATHSSSRRTKLTNQTTGKAGMKMVPLSPACLTSRLVTACSGRCYPFPHRCRLAHRPLNRQ